MGETKFEFLFILAYNQWMENNGGAIVNIIIDMFKGVPQMR